MPRVKWESMAAYILHEYFLLDNDFLLISFPSTFDFRLLPGQFPLFPSSCFYTEIRVLPTLGALVDPASSVLIRTSSSPAGAELLGGFCRVCTSHCCSEVALEGISALPPLHCFCSLNDENSSIKGAFTILLPGLALVLSAIAYYKMYR